MDPEWLDALTDPRTYPHPVAKIEILQTHISWVVLTGEWVYKLKKPVDFGFVNWTTLERRRTDCLEELRLNKRTAPDLYVDVMALTSEPLGPRFGGNGPVIEYAVRMRQFPEQDLFDHRLAHHDLHDEQIDLLAQQVAQLHDQATRAPIESPFGEPDLIRQAVEECLQSLQETSLPVEQRNQLDALSQWMNAEWSRLKDAFVQRKRRGWVRECHGDLHLGNIVNFHGQPTLFDCLEFNPNLRWIDVISDVAFLFMDLQDHHAGQLAWRFLNTWLERTGDFRALQVLRYYCVYRALVRAKVAALRGKQAELSAAEAQQQRQRLQDYVELGNHLTRFDRPALVLMHGVSGSGKSFVARQIASIRGAVLIRSDVERKRMFAAKPAKTDSSPTQAYSPRATELNYHRLQVLARQITRDSGYSVVVDATFLLREQRRPFMAMAKQSGIPVIIVACTAPETILRKRVEQRLAAGNDPSDASVAILERQLASLEPIESGESNLTVVSDTTVQDIHATLQSIQRLLGTHEDAGQLETSAEGDH